MNKPIYHNPKGAPYGFITKSDGSPYRCPFSPKLDGEVPHVFCGDHCPLFSVKKEMRGNQDGVDTVVTLNCCAGAPSFKVEENETEINQALEQEPIKHFPDDTEFQ